ncbi:MAG: hypothetical protein PF440_08810 [Thiomicrorhabdus sp.]|jgi:hypothetical protein|nr:hypothetical protein [Thiomicrorhabdus sp.]
MQYDLILDNEVVQTATFVPETIPAPSDKGTWLERSEVQPEMDMNFSFPTVVHTLTDTQSIHTHEPTYLEIPQIQRNLTRAIDRNTEASIVRYIGNAAKQRNKSALAVQLLLKKVGGSITTGEQSTLDELNLAFSTVETMISDGNAKEATVNAATITITELEAVVI